MHTSLLHNNVLVGSRLDRRLLTICIVTQCFARPVLIMGIRIKKVNFEAFKAQYYYCQVGPSIVLLSSFSYSLRFLYTFNILDQ